MTYRAYGIILSSSLELPELPPAPRADALLTIAVGTAPADRSGWSWLERRGEDGGHPWLAVGARDGAYLLTFDGGADFLVEAGGRTIVCCPLPNVPLNTIRHLVIDQVVPLVLGHGGRLVLHASAFVADGGAVALLGRAGAGKSTLAASFGLSGAAVIADDALVVNRDGGRMIVTPAYPGVRVWPDALPALGVVGLTASVAHYTDKRRLGGDAGGVRFTTDCVPLRRAYLLDASTAGGGIGIAPLSRRNAFIELVKHAFILDLADRRRLAGQFERLAADSAAFDVRRISYPDDLSLLPRVRAAILDDLEN